MAHNPPSMRVEVHCVERPKTIFGGWLFSLGWVGLVGGMMVMMRGRENRLPVWIILWLFAIAGAALLAATVWMTWGRVRFGNVRLWLDDPVLRRGGPLSASLVLPSRAPDANFVTATLTCLRCTMQGGHGSPMYGEQPLRSWSTRFPLRQTAGGSTAELHFTIPEDKPATDMPGETDHGSVGVVGFVPHMVRNHDYFAWVLRVEVDVPGVDLVRNYRLFVK